MTNDKVNQLEELLREAESNLETAARLLCNETDAGAIIYQSIKRTCNSVADICNYTYQLRDFD